MLAATICCGLGMMCTSCSSDDSSSNPPTPPTPPEVADYTVMLYCTGGENLDNMTEYDMMNACKGLKGNEQHVRFFIEYKYSSREGLDKQMEEQKGSVYLSGDGKGIPGALYRLELTSNMVDGNTMQYFSDDDRYGTQQEKSQLYQPDSIASFIKYCQKAGPAKNYILIIGDHGSGFHVMYDYDKNGSVAAKAARRAVCSDSFNDNKDISIKELRTGIEKSGVHLKLLNFDDCLMNNMEVLSEFTDVTDYLMASSHVTTGGDFEKFIKRLANAAKNNKFVDEMKQYTDEFIVPYNGIKEQPVVLKKYPNQMKYSDFCFTDMKKFKNVIPALKAFTEKLISEANKGTLTVEQQTTAACNSYQGSPDYPHYDIMSYAFQLQAADKNLVTEYNALKTAIEAARIKQVYTTVLSDYLRNCDYKELSYNITLGATVTCNTKDQKGKANNGTTHTILRMDIANEVTGDVRCLDEEGKTWWYETTENPKTFCYEPEDKSFADDKYAWSNSYELNALVQQTGWDRWLKTNKGFPTKNPPFTKFE